MKLPAIAIAAAMLSTGCTKPTVIGLDGREYVVVQQGDKPGPKPGKATLWQVTTNRGPGRPVYVESISSPKLFISSGTL